MRLSVIAAVVLLLACSSVACSGGDATAEDAARAPRPATDRVAAPSAPEAADEAADIPSFHAYAGKLMAALVAKDRDALAALVGPQYVISEQNLAFAFGSGSGEGTLHRVLSRDGIITVIESVQVGDGSWIARIYFVEKARLAHPEEPALSQVYALKKNEDYVVCEVVFRDGQYGMRDHFFYNETDL
jgi:hypothetical protein